MAQSVALLRLLPCLDPRLEEIVHPHLPLVREIPAARAGRGDQVEPNPQPLPRREVVPLATVEHAAAAGRGTG